MVNENLDWHQAEEDRWIDKMIERNREYSERFDAPSDAQVLHRLPHDKRGVPVVCGMIVVWNREEWTVNAITIDGSVRLRQSNAYGGERTATTAAAAVEVVDFGKPYF
jgi:hypothetical protein